MSEAAVLMLIPFLRGFSFVWRPTISADVSNYNLKSAALAAGWDGVAPLDAIVTVGSGIVLSATTTSIYGFDTGSGFPDSSALTLVMPGYVCGMGGAGGAGTVYSGGSGLAGGAALIARYAITIDALGGTIAGGGGGSGAGGGGGSYTGIGGNGGRSGRTNSAGGAGQPNGKPGTFSAPGTYGGKSGGSWGAAGDTGVTGGYSGGAGGAGGAAVVGNSYITWINVGTRYGSIS